jgi:hypothetical protein
VLGDALNGDAQLNVFSNVEIRACMVKCVSAKEKKVKVVRGGEKGGGEKGGGEKEQNRTQDTRIFRLTTWFNNVANNFAVNLHVRNGDGEVRVLGVRNDLLKNLLKRQRNNTWIFAVT